MGDVITRVLRRSGTAVLIVAAGLAFAGSATAGIDPGHDIPVVWVASHDAGTAPAAQPTADARPQPALTLRGRSTFRPTHPTRGASASAVVTT
jgi:hypothetical protein